MSDIEKYEEVDLTLAIKVESGKIAIINKTVCSGANCRIYGCEFPDCAIFSGEEFGSLEEAEKAHPDLIWCGQRYEKTLS